MKFKRTITIEFDRVKITTTHCAKNIFRCDLCGTETEFLTHTEVLELVRIMQLQGLKIEQANLHFYQPNTEQIFICLNSILNGNYPTTNKITN